MRTRLVLATVFAGVAPRPGVAQDASRVFERHASAVAKVEVLEASTGAPSSVGTAFFVQDSLLLTNYHVVRDAVFEPEDYRVRLLTAQGRELEGARIVALDPIRDLTVVRVSESHDEPLVLNTDSIPNGEVLYSLGHPGDLRTAVVEGTFNGTVEKSAAPLAHFSGSLNPGMSGGPTVRASGEVVGINVSTAGNQLSFLIPARAAVPLLASAAGLDRPTLDELTAGADERIDDFQDAFFAGLVESGFETTSIGAAKLPSAPPGPLDCSANPHEVEEDRYEVVEFRCATEDRVMLGPRGAYDLAYLEHMHVAAGSLSVFAFAALTSEWYQTVFEWEAPANDDATAFTCEEDNLQEGLSAEMLVAFCVRRHRSHHGMYDLVLRSVLLGGQREAVVSTLRATPISFANALRLARRWLEAFSWS